MTAPATTHHTTRSRMCLLAHSITISHQIWDCLGGHCAMRSFCTILGVTRICDLSPSQSSSWAPSMPRYFFIISPISKRTSLSNRCSVHIQHCQKLRFQWYIHGERVWAIQAKVDVQKIPAHRKIYQSTACSRRISPHTKCYAVYRWRKMRRRAPASSSS